MDDLSHYSVVEHLRDGRMLEIRALRPDDRQGLLAAVDHASAQSRYRRFFGAKRHFTDKEIAFFLDVDFTNHVALVATADDNGERVIVGGARAVLMRHLIGIARRSELAELTAEVLPDNAPMLKLFERCGFPLSKRRDTEAVHMLLQLG